MQKPFYNLNKIAPNVWQANANIIDELNAIDANKTIPPQTILSLAEKYNKTNFSIVLYIKTLLPLYLISIFINLFFQGLIEALLNYLTKWLKKAKHALDAAVSGEIETHKNEVIKLQTEIATIKQRKTEPNKDLENAEGNIIRNAEAFYQPMRTILDFVINSGSLFNVAFVYEWDNKTKQSSFCIKGLEYDTDIDASVKKYLAKKINNSKIQLNEVYSKWDTIEFSGIKSNLQRTEQGETKIWIDYSNATFNKFLAWQGSVEGWVTEMIITISNYTIDNNTKTYTRLVDDGGFSNNILEHFKRISNKNISITDLQSDNRPLA